MMEFPVWRQILVIMSLENSIPPWGSNCNESVETAVTSPAQIEILNQKEGKHLSPDRNEESGSVNLQIILL